jgi:hypothetical protein
MTDTRVFACYMADKPKYTAKTRRGEMNAAQGYWALLYAVEGP